MCFRMSVCLCGCKNHTKKVTFNNLAAQGSPRHPKSAKGTPKDSPWESKGLPKGAQIAGHPGHPKEPKGNPKSAQRGPAGDFSCSKWSKTLCRCGSETTGPLEDSEQAKPGQPKPTRAKLSQAKLSQGEPSQARPSPAKPS